MKPYRLKLVIAYDGAPFEGWQSQACGNTVQDHISRALETIAGAPVTLHGAGRTDAGVHALAQVAHADLSKLTPAGWIAALNGNLPPEIRILRATRAPADFHARFSATGKVYRYRIWNTRFLHPLEIGRAWHVPARMDLPRLTESAGMLEGRHDFRGFAANRGKPEENTTRTIASIRVRRAGDLVTLTFTGDGFLYKMVRLLTGSLVRVAVGREEPEWIARLLREGIKTSHCAPAHGLYLVRVLY